MGANELALGSGSQECGRRERFVQGESRIHSEMRSWKGELLVGW